MQLPLILTIATTAVIGAGAGMSFDQAIKQLPARRRIGAVAYSAYSRAGDQGNGLFLYPPMGIAALVLAVAAALSGRVCHLPSTLQVPLDISGVLAGLHSLVTARAAPINFSQRKYEPSDEANLARVLDRFAFWHNLRTVLGLNLAKAEILAK
ncbi:MAG TPA: hypothetical protein VGY31_14050 [Terriglobia bacterium]|nr:hypothetical protein [Terriglobia bacterium]